ncbi:hypothetical protein GCM10011348_06400 [Marinobacterium nitratireducens]|uniref:Transmembrane protein n=1 Tax=Marinobacterium nitratireducens TaxID=518897 RepID=A0A917Z7C5_9GAMM|nr:hypothetical protein [Marinobacterium nitratireducens]GGO77269.1 hypothetical protein GCM10011348_06400 [Marinobacterium nitratireducens]
MLRIGLLLLVLPGLVMMGAYMFEQSAVDACLDGGGSWNYDAGACDSTGNHPFVPFSARHPLLVNGGMLLSVVGLLFCLAGLYRRRT